MDNLDQYDFTDNYADIVHALIISNQSGNVIAFNIPACGSVFISAVDNIATEGNDLVVTLKSTDITGTFLDKNKFNVSEIKSVCPLLSKWQNPHLKELYKNNTPSVNQTPTDDSMA